SVDLPPAPTVTAVQPPQVPDVSGWTKPGPTHGRTASVWWIVVMPILQLMLLVGLVLANPSAQGLLFEATPMAMPPSAEIMSAILAFFGWIVLSTALASMLGILAVLWLGFRDRAALRTLGHERTAAPWWTLLSPLVYLAIRTYHVQKATGRGSWPLTVWVILYVLPTVGILIAQFAVGLTSGS
ncbi:MAG: hypothetical protein ABWX59_01525, partial [Microbacteriaceae bacterium]